LCRQVPSSTPLRTGALAVAFTLGRLLRSVRARLVAFRRSASHSCAGGLLCSIPNGWSIDRNRRQGIGLHAEASQPVLVCLGAERRGRFVRTERVGSGPWAAELRPLPPCRVVP